MAATLLSVVVTCISSLFLGQAALRLAGAREWSWLAPPVGLSVGMLIAVPAIGVPGESTTMAVVIAVLTVAAIAWCLRSPEHRPPIAGLVSVIPVVFLTLIPFLAAGRSGILGVTVDNDMAAHMSLAIEAFLGEGANYPHPPLLDLYPVGPHATVAVIAETFDVGVVHAFTGWSMALPVITAWTALALLRRGGWLKQTIVATLVAMPFLVTAYYAEGSFKEVAQAGLVLAVVVFFAGSGPSLGRGRWVPLALLLGGIVSVYSVTGLVWPVMIGGLWLLGEAAGRIARRGIGGIWEEVRRELPSIGIGAAVLVVPLLPQASRIALFISENSGSNGIIVPRDVLGNLVGPLPVWEAFGIWDNPDFRLPATPPFSGGLWTVFIVALVVLGALWMLRRGRWLLPLAAAGSLAIWAVSKDSQSPYVVAKALVIASPLLMATAVLALVEHLPEQLPRRISSPIRVPTRALPTALATLLIAALAFQVGSSDVRALRSTPVGPTDQEEQLRQLRPLLDGEPTLFLGDDDFIKWELVGVFVATPVFGGEESMIRPGKGWTRGMALDFDTVDAATLNSYRWVITTRDAAGSEPPPQMHLVKSTESFELWRREGQVLERQTLAEGGAAGAILDCKTAKGRAVLSGGGVVAVRPRPVEAEGMPLAPGGEATLELSLAPGRWDLTSSYLSRLPIDVSAAGLDATLPPNLDRPGPRWPIGEIAVRGKAPTVLTFRVGEPLFAPNMVVANLGTIVATRRAPERVIPIARACGRYVDWYRPAAGRVGQ
jgi:hypothetical protein